jgi:hypothetical protein
MDMMWTLLKRSRAKDATTEGAIAAGVTVTSMMVSIPKSSRRAPLSLAMKVPAASGRGRGSPTLKTFKPIGKALPGYGWHHIVAQTTENIRRFGAENIHNANNLVLLPHGPGTIQSRHSQGSVRPKLLVGRSDSHVRPQPGLTN